jgi:hypothetical protein
MTHREIMQHRIAGSDNWQILRDMIARGYSYEYAAYEIACALRMAEEEREEMATDYATNQPKEQTA